MISCLVISGFSCREFSFLVFGFVILFRDFVFACFFCDLYSWFFFP